MSSHEYQLIKKGARGDMQAIQHSAGIVHPDVDRFRQEYQLFSNTPAKVRYADKWIELIGRRMNDTWPMLYGALKIVRDDELFKAEACLLEGKTFATFEEYFEARMGRPFALWVELEATYRFAEKYAPDLLGKGYEEAKAKVAKLAESPLSINETAGNPVGSNQYQKVELLYNNNSTPKRQGTSSDYLTARIARDRPDILERMKAGEFPSVRKAAIAAGIVREASTLEQLQRLWRKATPEERAAFFSFIETPED